MVIALISGSAVNISVQFVDSCIIFTYAGKYCFVRLNIDKNVCTETRTDLHVENKVCGALDSRIHNSNNRIFIQFSVYVFQSLKQLNKLCNF